MWTAKDVENFYNEFIEVFFEDVDALVIIQGNPDKFKSECRKQMNKNLTLYGSPVLSEEQVNKCIDKTIRHSYN